MKPRLPLTEEQLDGRFAPAHLRPFAPRVHALIESVLRLRDELGHGPGGDPHSDPVPEVCEERWFWQRQLRSMAADLARLVAGRQAREREAATTVENLRRGDFADRMKYEALASFIVRLEEEGPEGSDYNYGDGIAPIGAITRRVGHDIEAAWDAANPEAAAGYQRHRDAWDAAEAAKKAAKEAGDARIAAAPRLTGEQVADVQAMLDRHTAEVADKLATLGDAVGQVNAKHATALIVNGQGFINSAKPIEATKP